MNLTRMTRNTSAAVVAGVAAIASYSHMRDLAAAHGQSELLANLMPISVDGMLIVSTVVMADDRAGGRAPRASAKVSFVIGVAASIVANVLAAPDNALARTISAWPAVALLLVVEMLSRSGKPSDTHPAAEVVPSVGVTEVPAPVAEVAPAAPAVDAKPAATRTRPRSLTSEQKVTRAAAKMPAGTVAQIAAKAGVSESTARRYMPANLASPSGPDAAETRVNGHRPGVEVPA